MINTRLDDEAKRMKFGGPIRKQVLFAEPTIAIEDDAAAKPVARRKGQREKASPR